MNSNLKFLGIIILFILAMFMFLYREEGTTSLSLSGDSGQLPTELKGLKIYNVSTGFGKVKVAVLNGSANSTTYQVGKTQQSTIIVNQNTDKAIFVSQILFENDTIVVARK